MQERAGVAWQAKGPKSARGPQDEQAAGESRRQRARRQTEERVRASARAGQEALLSVILRDSGGRGRRMCPERGPPHVLTGAAWPSVAPTVLAPCCLDKNV